MSQPSGSDVQVAHAGSSATPQGNLQAANVSAAPLPQRVAQVLARLKRTPSAAAYWLGASPLAIGLPLMVLVGFVSVTARNPRVFSQQTLDLHLASEDAIPAAIPSRAIDMKDPTWLFRYGNTGTEFRSGIPYWVFRVMPRIFDDEFKGQGYERFGFGDDSQDYYFQRPVGRGLILSDATLHLPGYEISTRIKRVAINCSGCHRGEYQDGKGRSHFVDGMPNHTADLQGFKRFFTQGFKDPRFTPERVIAEINHVLIQEEHRPPLTRYEELIYVLIVQGLKRSSELLPELAPDNAWMNKRAENGPGRIDPFNAFKFEIIGVPDDNSAAQVDFPSIWNQRRELRSWHHYDGNTDDSRARNFGSILGVGGMFLSIPKGQVLAVGEWLDVLPSPAYPFEPPEPARVSRGLLSFRTHCAVCHGLYDRSSNRVTEVENSRYMQVDPKVGTDPERLKAFAPGAAAALNDFGERRALWRKDAFRSTGAYLAGPLDGIWARAPYLHNGSVPSLAALLKPPPERPKTFYRGSHRYDTARLGWQSEQPHEAGRTLFLYRTVDERGLPIPGNSNAGHPYSVPTAEQADLIEYLKTL